MLTQTVATHRRGGKTESSTDHQDTAISCSCEEDWTACNSRGRRLQSGDGLLVRRGHEFSCGVSPPMRGCGGTQLPTRREVGHREAPPPSPPSSPPSPPTICRGSVHKHDLTPGEVHLSGLFHRIAVQLSGTASPHTDEFVAAVKSNGGSVLLFWRGHKLRVSNKKAGHPQLPQEEDGGR